MASNTPAKKTAAKKAAPVDDIRDIEYDATDESFTAHLFDEDTTFKFSTDVNAFILSGAMSGGVESIGSMRKLLLSLVMIPEVDEGEDLELVRMAERDRFIATMERQQKLSMERLAGLLGDLLEAAGKETES